MANYILTLKKSSADQVWLKMNDKKFLESNFTASEVTDILTPYKNFVESLPGYQSSNTNIIDSVTMEIITTFDTIENANNALTQLTPPFTSDSIQDKQHQLITSKRQELGVTYTISNRVE
jgi:hypothetical protein